MCVNYFRKPQYFKGMSFQDENVKCFVVWLSMDGNEDGYRLETT
jgi:hypothetical protein